jgi:D-3-phosphoglycerate dehydrogenase
MSRSAEVLVTDHVFGDLETERAALKEIGATLTEDREALGRAAALLVCFAPVPAAMIEAAASCRIIARYGIGVDNVDVEAATRRGVLVTNVPDYCLDEVADHTLALLLGAARRIVIEGEVRRIRGRRLALIGAGRIGGRVAERATAFGLDVVVYDPYVSDTGFEEALAEADFVSLHAPLTDETRHLIDDDAIALMRRSPVLINTSRGGLVDLDAVVRALGAGALSGAALDVTEPEPLPDGHPLRSHPRAIITPHAAFRSVEAQAELQRRAVEEVVRALTGRPPRCPVNREVILT